MKVLETRETDQGYKRRRYESAGGVRTTTIEIPYSVFKFLNKAGRGTNRIAANQRALAGKSRQAQGLALLKAGRKPYDIAKILAVSPSTVYRWQQRQEASS